MKNFFTYIFFVFALLPHILFSQEKFMLISGTVYNTDGKTLAGVNILMDEAETGTSTNAEGKYFLKIKKQNEFSLSYSHIGYKKFSKKISVNYATDSIVIDVGLKTEISALSEFIVKANRPPDTVFASVIYNIADFEFYNDKLILLAYKKKPEKDSEILLADENSNILSNKEINLNNAEFFKDYEGNINLVGKDTAFLISVKRDELFLHLVSFSDFNLLVKPCVDVFFEKIIFSDFNFSYPEFNYYTYEPFTREISAFKNVVDKPLMREFRYEYYFLPPREKLQARRFAMEYNTDKHIVAAAMTGFQKSFYYTPLYAPLFVVNDSVLIFDHYENKLYFYNEFVEQTGSIDIEYHLAKNEKWKRTLIKDEQNDKIYSLYQKNGFYYLKKIDLNTGKIISSFKLYHKYVQKIKIKNSYVYYTYRPFESLQNTFLYKELISSE